MSFFSQLASAVANNLVNSFTNSGPVDPLKVIEVSSSSFVSRAICKREQCLVLYGTQPGVMNPAAGGNNNPAACFELVMAQLMTGNREKVLRYSFVIYLLVDQFIHYKNLFICSLCRSPDLGLVDRHFEMAREKLPILARIYPEVCCIKIKIFFHIFYIFLLTDLCAAQVAGFVEPHHHQSLLECSSRCELLWTQ